MADELKCPICSTQAKPLDRTGDASGFDCPEHGKFKVGDTSMVTMKDRPRREWEAALVRAKSRTKSGDWPLIKEGDF